MKAQESDVRTAFEFTQHPRHCERDRKPLAQLPEAVDPHADQEHDHLAIRRCRHALGDYFCHWCNLLRRHDPTASFAAVASSTALTPG
jgi:hypothetical protein